MKTIKLEFDLPDDVYEELSKHENHLKGGFIESILKDVYSVMIGETRGYFFPKDSPGHGIAILNKEWVDEVLKREYHIDENAVKERDKLQSKIDRIKQIIEN